MTGIALPQSFQASIKNSAVFPDNTILRSIDVSPSVIAAIKQRFEAVNVDLLEEDGEKWEIPIRDLCTADGQAVDKRNIHSYEGLNQWLGISRQGTPAGGTIMCLKRDPKCRFISLYGAHSRAPLKLSKAMLLKLMTYHQVTPAFLDFLSVFGQQNDPRDELFTGFREQAAERNPPEELVIPELGRSGRFFQLCYNLKSIALKIENTENITETLWSVRQAAIYLQFDVLYGTTVWIVAKGNTDIQERFKVLTSSVSSAEGRSFGTPAECLVSSLVAHVLYAQWAAEGWRAYLQWLETVIDAISEMAVYGPSGERHSHKTYTPQDIQDLQIYEEKANKAITILESNTAVLSALISFYRRLMRDRHFPMRKTSPADIEVFVNRTEGIITDLKMHIARAVSLVRRTSDRRVLVIQHLQSQSASRMETLSRKMEQESIILLIIAIITLLYLPATFVSTFFSTDVVKYQGQDDPNGNYSEVAMERWLQVTLPLTFVTGAFAWGLRRWMQGAEMRRSNIPRSSIPRRAWLSVPMPRAGAKIPLLPLSRKMTTAS